MYLVLQPGIAVAQCHEMLPREHGLGCVYIKYVVVIYNIVMNHEQPCLLQPSIPRSVAKWMFKRLIYDELMSHHLEKVKRCPTNTTNISA